MRRIEDRFEEKYIPEPNSGCWIWVGAHNTHGYGNFWDGNKYISAHRFSFIINGGVIEDGLDLDHLCRVRSCVNPDHLEPVTRRENLRRGLGNQHAQKTHCAKGHPYRGKNLWRGPRGSRRCRACTLEAQRRAYWRKKNHD